MKREKIVKLGIIALILAALLIIPACAEEAPETTWTKTFGGASSDRARSVQQTADGGYIVAGDTRSYGAGSCDFWLVKTDPCGDEQWNKTYGGEKSEEAYSVQQTTDGGYIVAGRTQSYGASDSDFWLVKTDSKGNEQWNKTYDRSGYDEAWSVQQTTDGGYILAGFAYFRVTPWQDFWLVKTDSKGNKQWDKTHGGRCNEAAHSVQQTTDGGYILAGWTHSYGAGQSDLWLLKTDSSGDELWNRTYGGTDYEQAYSVHQTTDGGYIVAGETRSYDAGSEEVWLIKTDSNGNKQWDRTYGGTRSEAYSVQQTADGGYIVAGYTYSYGTGGDDFWLVKTDSSGNEQWNKTYGGTGGEEAWSVQQTTDGGYILAGYTDSYDAGGRDFWLVKVGWAPSICIYTDKTTYSSGDPMHLGLDVLNPGDAQEVHGKIWIEAPTGIVKTLVDKTVTLSTDFEYSNPYFRTFKRLPGKLPSGEYTWYAQLSDPTTEEVISCDTAVWTFTG